MKGFFPGENRSGKEESKQKGADHDGIRGEMEKEEKRAGLDILNRLNDGIIQTRCDFPSHRSGRNFFASLH